MGEHVQENAESRLWLGYTLLPISRKDINNYIPFPGVLSLLSTQFRRKSG